MRIIGAIIALSVFLGPAVSVAQSAQEAIRNCDVRSSHPRDPMRRAPGVSDDQMVPLDAIDHCQAAVAIAPHEARLWFQLGRAYWLARRDREAFDSFSKAQTSNYAPAVKYLGDSYFSGRGLPPNAQKNPERAVTLWKRAADLGFPDGMDMADEVIKQMKDESERAAKEAFEPSIFQNAQLMSALYTGRFDRVPLPHLMIYASSIVKELGGSQNDRILFMDPYCRTLSTYAADVLAPYGSDIGKFFSMFDAVGESFNKNDDPAAVILKGIIGLVANSFEVESIEVQGKRDAVMIMNRYSCNSAVARTIMNNIVSVAQSLASAARSASNEARGLQRGPNRDGSASTSPSSPSAPNQSLAFSNGSADRRTWESWFAGLSGDFRRGAEFWAGVRSNPNPGSCYDAQGRSYGNFTDGCLAAQKFLNHVDQRRRAEPEYRAGWNNY